MKLNIGCGGKRIEGYTGVDKFATPAVDIITPAHKLGMFEDGTIDEIYTSHMIEHLPPDEFYAALVEWHRVLKVGGTVRIRCPNFELYAKEWLGGNYAYRWGLVIIKILGHQDRGQGMLNRNGFTVRRLKALMEMYGFETVICCLSETRAQTFGKEEYRKKGDIVYSGKKSLIR